VSGAAGAVGSVVCQIAKARGCTVIGSAGGAEKLEFLREIGVDHGFDYRRGAGSGRALARVAPKGIDVYFDNVGGDHLEAALTAPAPSRASPSAEPSASTTTWRRRPDRRTCSS
jgi:NADPH-dependent curcumin reductase CurA